LAERYSYDVTKILCIRVGFLPQQKVLQKVFLPGQWKKPVKTTVITGKNGNKFSTLNWIEILGVITMHH